MSEDKLKIKLEPGVGKNHIKLFQDIEKEIDNVLTNYGFTRAETSKTSDFVEFRYTQFGVCRE